MNETTPTQSDGPHSTSPDTGFLDGFIAGIAAEFEVAMGSPERVRKACSVILERLGEESSQVPPEAMERLFPLLGNRSGAIASHLFDFFNELAARSSTPWPFLEAMLCARDRDLLRSAFRRAAQLAAAGRLPGVLAVSGFLAERMEAEGTSLGETEFLSSISELLHTFPSHRPELHLDPVVALYLDATDGKLRRLAAHLLDLSREPAPTELAVQILGEGPYEILAPYLAYSRATHVDILNLVPVAGPPICLPGLQQAEAICGNALLREAIAELGWARINFGLEVKKFTAISIGGSFPLMVSPSEATLFSSIEEARKTGEFFLFIAHGGIPLEKHEVAENDIVSRFRSYNVTHSEVLADILDVAPLTREKVERIVSRMDSIITDFVALFSSYAEECAILPGLYRDLRQRILAELDRESTEPQLSPELTRLVQMFEDPESLGSVRTLHGLKRFLHQRGLRLGFRLVESGRATNRTVTLLVASPKRILHITQDMNYVNFGSEKDAAILTRIPYSVGVVVDGFGRQIINGQYRLPTVKIFCYGNEVHYYLAFLNHPAFLRIDYSPPLRGGMIDLEYFGVSKHEIDLHPNISLDAVQHFFQKLEFDVQVENTRVHARYDKERALGLGDICEKAEALLRLAPYLMELDWVIGFLDLTREGRRTVADEWAKFFLRWGVLPVQQLLSQNRQEILIAVESGTAGDREVTWSGREPYRDRFTKPTPDDLFDTLRACMSDLGIETSPLFEEGGEGGLGQIPMETLFLSPLRKALASGEIVETLEGFQRSSHELFQRKHEAEFFAEILSAEDETGVVAPSLAPLLTTAEGNPAVHLGVKLSSFLLAHMVGPLERTVRFQTSGSLNGFDVQRATMALCGKSLGLYVLRDGAGIIRLAIFSYGDPLYLTRRESSLAWQSNGSIDASEFAELLWLNNYQAAGMETVKTDVCDDAESVLACFRRMNPLQRPKPIPGDNMIEGLKASPGRAVGRVLCAAAGRVPEDFKDAIFLAPAIHPEDNTFLYHSAGIVSVGGGILSHAGLIAIQFHKPALIISGRWHVLPTGAPTVLYSTLEYREEEREVQGFRVCVRLDARKRERRLEEGDLVVLDAEEGFLRVLGQDREVLGLHESFRHLGEVGHRLACVNEEKEILVLRGRRLRSRHLIEKQLTQLSDVLLAHHVVHELFFGKHLSADGGGKDDKSKFLCLLLSNRNVGEVARDNIFEISRSLQHRYVDRSEEARRRIPVSRHPYEILSLRLQVIRLCRSLAETSISLMTCGIRPVESDDTAANEISVLALERLQTLRGELAGTIEESLSTRKIDYRLRHIVRQVQRLDMVLETPPETRASIDELKNSIVLRDEEVRRELGNRRVLGPEDGGFELFSVIGWKAANLAEIERLGGRGLVPPWFVVTDRAFQDALDSPLDKKTAETVEGLHDDAPTVSRAIETILDHGDWNNSQKSRAIRQLWERITIPQPIVDEVLAAYSRLSEGGPPGNRSGGGRFGTLRGHQVVRP